MVIARMRMMAAMRLLAADSELCTLDHADLVALVRRHPRIAVRMLQSVTERLVRAERMLAAFGTTEVETRLAAWLLDQHIVDDAGRRMVVLPIEKKDIGPSSGRRPRP